jgi:ankyrin repeat protein
LSLLLADAGGGDHAEFPEESRADRLSPISFHELRVFLISYSRCSDRLFPIPHHYVHPLHYAAYCDSVDCLIYLLDAGVAVNIPSAQEFSPLHFACAAGAEECALILLERGANPNFSVREFTPLCGAAYSGNCVILQSLIDYGADISGPKSSIPRATQIAMKTRHVECVLMLLSYRCAQNVGGLTPLMLAVTMHLDDAIEPLINHGVSPGEVSGSISPLYLACIQGNFRAVRILVRSMTGFPLGPRRTTPLHWAALSGSIRMVTWIYENCDRGVNTPDESGLTPVYFALNGPPGLGEMSSIVRFLASKGATWENNANFLRRVVTLPSVPLEIVQFVAESSGRDEIGMTDAICLAQLTGRNDIVEYLKRLDVAG